LWADPGSVFGAPITVAMATSACGGISSGIVRKARRVYFSGGTGVGLLRKQDFWAGLLFIAFGASALWIGSGYKVGTLQRMGPGYFPVLLGTILCGLGLVIAFRGAAASTTTLSRGALRPFLVLIAIVAFAVLLPKGGLVLASLALVVISSLAGHEFRPKEVVITAAVLIVFSVVAFAWGLGLRFTIWPQWS